MKTKQSEDDLRLRRLLRRGDPAGGESLPAGQGLERMRRQILARSGGGRPFAPRLGLRWAVAVACVLLLATLGWQLRDRSLPQPVIPQVTAEREAPPVPAPAVGVEDVAVVAEDITIGEKPAEEPVAVVVSTEASEENLQARTLLFTTRSGTQIIWILDPELEL